VGAPMARSAFARIASARFSAQPDSEKSCDSAGRLRLADEPITYTSSGHPIRFADCPEEGTTEVAVWSLGAAAPVADDILAEQAEQPGEELVACWTL